MKAPKVAMLLLLLLLLVVELLAGCLVPPPLVALLVMLPLVLAVSPLFMTSMCHFASTSVGLVSTNSTGFGA